MSKPIIKKISPIDATKNNNYYSISYTGGISKVQTIVYNAETMAVITSPTVTTSSTTIPIPTSTSITNGNRYAIQTIVYDKSNNASAPSDKVFFWAFATPSFSFSNLTNSETANNEIDVSSFISRVIYSQSNQEKLNSYVFFVYNHGKNLISQSSTMYDVVQSEDNVNNYILTYTYKGLETGEIYYFRCTGVTKNGINVDTGFVKVFVNYDKSGTFSQISAFIKDPAKGCSEEGSNGIVKYTTNLIEVDATRDDYTYINDEKEPGDKLIDLRSDIVEYDQYYNDRKQFTIDGDWTIAIRVKDGNGKLMEFTDNISVGTLSAVQMDSSRYDVTLYSGKYLSSPNGEITSGSSGDCVVEIEIPEDSDSIYIDYIYGYLSSANVVYNAFYDSDNEVISSTINQIEYSYVELGPDLYVPYTGEDGNLYVDIDGETYRTDGEDYFYEKDGMTMGETLPEPVTGVPLKAYYHDISVDIPDDAKYLRFTAEPRDVGDFKTTTYPIPNNKIYRLTINNGISDYNIYSNPVGITKDSTVTLYVIKKGQLYDLIAYVDSEEEE